MDETYWNKKIETMPSEELKNLQLKELKKLVKHSYDNSPFYKKRFDSVKLKPENIKSLNDLTKIPFTVKNDLRVSSLIHPLGLLAVSLERLVSFHIVQNTYGYDLFTGGIGFHYGAVGASFCLLAREIRSAN